MKNKGAVAGLVVILAALGFSARAFKNSLISYVPFGEAMQATDTTVQVFGAPVAGTMRYDRTAQALRFLLRDDRGRTLPVVFHGPKPEDLDSAMSKATGIDAQGTYDPARRVFVAENLLVKCPSKYANGSGSQRSYGAS